MKATQTFSNEYLENCKSISLEARFEFLDNFAKLNVHHYILEYESKQQDFYRTINNLNNNSL